MRDTQQASAVPVFIGDSASALSVGIEARDLRVTVREAGRQRVVLDLPELRLEAGSSLGITGPSGCGKTTLLHVLAGLLPPDGGRVWWNGEAVYDLSEARRDVLRARAAGMVFQDFQLLGGLSALDNVLLPLSFRHWRPAEAERARALDLLERLGVGHPRTRAEKLSRGEMQRVGLARAFLGGCGVLFADEPTAGLDAANARQVAAMLLDLCRERGVTLACVTHDADLAARFDRRLCLAAGRLVSGGDAYPPAPSSAKGSAERGEVAA